MFHLPQILFFIVAMGLIQPLQAQLACLEENCCCGDENQVVIPCGSFEDPPFANPIIVFFAGDMYCNWTVYSGSIDLLGPNYSNWASGNPNGASQFIDLHGNTPGSFGTTVTGLVPGQTYILDLWYAKNAGAFSANCRVEVAGGIWLDETFTATNNGADGWLEKCFLFTALASSADLSFTGSGGIPAGGVLLDDITLWSCPQDTEPPEINNMPVSPLILECGEPVPSADLGVMDNCTSQVTEDFQEEEEIVSCGKVITRSWTFTDECGNSTTAEQEIQIFDSQPPVFDPIPQTFFSSCGDDYLTQFNDWIQDHGFGSAIDNCDTNLEWTVEYPQLPDGSCGSTPVTFTVTDDCGWTQEIQVEFLIQDDQPPILLASAEDVTVYCAVNPEADLGNWLEFHGGAEAEDPCGPVIWTDNFDGNSSPDSISVMFTATDSCGNAVSTTAVFWKVTAMDTIIQVGGTCDSTLIGSDTTVVVQQECETVIITITSLWPADTTILEAQTCDPLLAGTDTLFLQNGAGCDSLVITKTRLTASDTTFLSAGTCDPAQAGADTLFLQNTGGCDSLVITLTSLYPSPTTSVMLSTCDPAQAGTDTLWLQTVHGCDSTVVVQTVYTGQYEETVIQTICGAGADGLDTLVVTGGPCDSLFITAFVHVQPDTTWLTGETCQAAQAGTTVEVFPGWTGCDSTVITVTILLPVDTTVLQGLTCDPAAVGTSSQVLANQWGCDSLVITTTDYAGIDTQFVHRQTCDPVQAGVLVDILPGPACDTVRVTETVLVAAVETNLSEVVCDLAGPAKDTTIWVSVDGCDSLVIREYRHIAVAGQSMATPETCAGAGDGRVEAKGTTGGDSPYQWRLNGGPWQDDPVFTGLMPGLYTVEIRDTNGCRDTLTVATVGVGAEVILDAGPDREADPGQIIGLSVQSSVPLVQVTWTAADPLVCPTCAQTSLGPLTGNQTVTVTGLTAGGCPGTDGFMIRLTEKQKIFIPESFTPNGDGVNDRFTVYTGDPDAIVEELAVFDRWGNALFRGREFAAGDPGLGWDGQFRGAAMDPGVFVYTVRIRMSDSSVHTRKGGVVLVK